jgi:hypothetical protein
METSNIDFEELLDQGEEFLREARECYEEVSRTEDAPEAVIQAISQLDQELTDLAKVTTVNQPRLQQARQIKDQAVLLRDVLEAFQQRQRAVIEHRVETLSLWVDQLTRTAGQSGFDVDSKQSVESLQETITLFEHLMAADEYGRISDNDRITLPEFLNDLRQFDAELRELVSFERYARICLDVVDDLLDVIHEELSTLPDAHSSEASFSRYLQQVKEHRADAEESLEQSGFERASQKARIALEGTLMVNYEITRVKADELFASELRDALSTHGFESKADIESTRPEMDAEELLERAVGAIESSVELTVDTRIQRLLEEYDGSVNRVIEQSDLDGGTILNHIMKLYKNDRIEDLVVNIKS